MLTAIILQMKPPVQNQLFDRTGKQMSLTRYECVCVYLTIAWWDISYRSEAHTGLLNFGEFKWK